MTGFELVRKIMATDESVLQEIFGYELTGNDLVVAVLRNEPEYIENCFDAYENAIVPGDMVIRGGAHLMLITSKNEYGRYAGISSNGFVFRGIERYELRKSDASRDEFLANIFAQQE